jgi:uncharacterized protein YjdB
MATSLGKVLPFVKVNRSAQLHGTSDYPFGGTNPASATHSGNDGGFSNTVPHSGAPLPGADVNGPLAGTNYINILNLRDYYKLPYPPATPLASPPVIGIVSFGGGIYGQPVSSGKYSGFWRCTDISGASGAPIQILVAPINGAINAPNADDGGATLENTVDVATVNAFYGMINQGRDAPIYTPPVIILYIAPSDDMEEVYKTFYTVLKNPVVCNGNSYLPSVVCCSWGAPEVAWTQKMAFPPSGKPEDVDNNPNPVGIAIMNEINDLLADATRRGINICVASGDIRYPGDTNNDNTVDQDDIGSSTIMFPASSPYVTCVGGSSVFFPNGPVRNYNNPGEFAWSRANGGVSGAFPIPDYQSNLPGSALISANAFLSSSRATATLLETSLGAANTSGVIADLSGLTMNASLSALTKDDALNAATLAYNNAVLAYQHALQAGGSDSATLQLQLAMTVANTALEAARNNSEMAALALVDAQDAVVKTSALEALIKQAAVAYKVADNAIDSEESPESDPSRELQLSELARDAALLVLNQAVAQGASSVFAPSLVSKLTSNITSGVANADDVLKQLINPYDPYHPVKADARIPENLVSIYRLSGSSYLAKDNLTNLVNDAETVLDDVLMFDGSGNAYDLATNDQVNSVNDELSVNADAVTSVVSRTAQAARLAKTVSDNTDLYLKISADWDLAKTKYDDAVEIWSDVVERRVPESTEAEFSDARADLIAASDELTRQSVLLADANAANLYAANTLKAVTEAALTAVEAAAYQSLFSGAANLAVLSTARLDASGADVNAATVRTDAGSSVIVKLGDVAAVADQDADEAKRCYNVWVAAITAANAASGSSAVAKAMDAVITASEGAIAAAVRAASSMNAVSVLLNNARITQAVSTWSAAAARTAVNTALTDVNACVSDIKAIIAANPNGKTALGVATNLVAAYGALNSVTSRGTVNTAVLAVISATAGFLPVSPATTPTTVRAAALKADVKSMVASVLLAEGSAIYSASITSVLIDDVVAGYTAGVSAQNAIYDNFNAMNISAKNASDLAKEALFRANLASARINLTSSTFGTVAQATLIINQSMYDAASASTAAANAMVLYNNLVYSFSSVTPALIDAAVRSQLAIKKAADSSNLATAAASPAPVTPQMVANLQGLVLKAKASTQLALENNPTNVNLQATLALWNTAVTAGAAAVAGIADTLDTDSDPEKNLALYNLFLAFANNNISNGPLGAIEVAYTQGTNKSSYNFPTTSDMYITGKAAYDFATTYFTIGINGGNLRYVMSVANSKIVAAWNAAQASNVAGSNAARIAAEENWESAANKMAVILSAGFTTSTMDLPNVLHDAVCLAYQKTTGEALDSGDTYKGVAPVVGTAADTVSTSDAYVTALAAYKAFMVAYDSYNTDFLKALQENSDAAAEDKDLAQVAIALAIDAAARTNAAARKSARDSSVLATSSPSLQNLAALAAAEAAYSAADNVNMYRCLPDIAMHSNADDLPVIFRLNGDNVYVGGTSIAAAMFAGFLGVVQSHNPINYFMNPVLYNNFTYPSPLFYDISGTSELLNPGNVTSRYDWVVSEELDDMSNSLTPLIHGSYNPRVGLGSIRADSLSAFLETPNLVNLMVTGPYPVDTSKRTYVPVAPARPTVEYVDVRPGTSSDVYVFVAPSAAYNTNVTWSCSSPYNATVSPTLEAYGPVDIKSPGSSQSVYAMVYRARVTGVVTVDPLAPVPVITIASTDGSNVFTTINVRVLPAVQVTGISISAEGQIKNPANTVLYLGKSLQLIATVTPSNATNKNVYWWSSNTSVVNVDVNGLLTPLSPGQVTIKATTVNNNISASISVYVPTPMTGISVMPSMVTLNPNMLVYPLKNTQLLKALVMPEDADYKNLTWEIVSSQALHLPTGTKTQLGGNLYYAGDNTVDTPVISIASAPGTVKRDSSGNVIDNTQEVVTAISNGNAVIRVSTNGVTDAVYGTYSANVMVNVVTPITNVTLEQTNMVIDLNPQTNVGAVNPRVNIQYGANNQNLSLPAFNAELPERNLPESYNVTATLFPKFPSNMNLIWSSSNPKVAIISNNTPPVLNKTASDPNFDLFQVTERITPLANGSTVIKVTTADGNKVATVNVTVTTPVTSIVLSAMPVTLNPGKQYALQATVLPTTASNAGLVWATTNSAVARVDQNGLVTAVASGSCGISVSTLDGDYTAIATINVVTPLVGVSLVLNTPTPIRIGDMVQILVVMTPTTASDQQFTWTVTNGINGNIFTNGPAQNGNIVYLDAAQAGSSVFTVTTRDGNKQANLALTVVPY